MLPSDAKNRPDKQQSGERHGEEYSDFRKIHQFLTHLIPRFQPDAREALPDRKGAAWLAAPEWHRSTP